MMSALQGQTTPEGECHSTGESDSVGWTHGRTDDVYNVYVRQLQNPVVVLYLI